MPPKSPERSSGENKIEKNSQNDVRRSIAEAMGQKKISLDADQQRRTEAIPSVKNDGSTVYVPEPAGTYREGAEQLPAQELEKQMKVQSDLMKSIEKQVKDLENLRKELERSGTLNGSTSTLALSGNLETLLSQRNAALGDIRTKSDNAEKILHSANTYKSQAEVMTALAKELPDIRTVGTKDAVTDEFILTARLETSRATIKHIDLVLVKLNEDFPASIAALVTTLEEDVRSRGNNLKSVISAKNPERKEFLNRIAGTPKPVELVTLSTFTEKRSGKELVDLQYLAYNVNFVTNDAHTENTVLSSLKKDLGLKPGENTVQSDRKEEIGRSVGKFLKGVDNPAGISGYDLLLRIGYSQDFVDKISGIKGMREDLFIGTVRMFETLQAGDKESIKKSLSDTVKKSELTQDQLIQALAFLTIDITNASSDWDAAKQKAAEQVKQLIADKVLEPTAAGSIGFVLKDNKVDESESVFRTKITLDAKTSDELIKIAKQKKYDVPWENNAKNAAKKLGETAAVAMDDWYRYMKTLPDLVMGDQVVLDAVKAQNSAQEALDVAKDLSGVKKNTETALKRSEKDMLVIQDAKVDATATSAPARTVLQRKKGAEDLVGISRFVHDRLEKEFGISNRPREVQDIAFWLALHKGMDTAGKYLNMNPPDVFALKLDASDMLELSRYERTLYLQDRSENILIDLNKRLGLTINPMALEILASVQGPDGKLLSEGEGRLEQWFLHPEKAGPALRAVFVGKPEATDAITQAFTSGTDQNFNGDVITNVWARAQVQNVLKHLQRQQDDYMNSKVRRSRDVRTMDPLDVLRSGKDAVMEMLQSGDRVQQGIAITMVVSALAGMYLLWTKGGKVGKGLLLSLPLFFGGDAILKKMTGRGFLDRVGLTYMNEKDRSSAVEQFMRKYENIGKYNFMKTPAGNEAMKQLTNPKNPVPVKDLLDWRASVQRSGDGADFAGTAPDSLKRAGSAVLGTLPLMTGNNTPTAEQKNIAYQYLFLSFEALCEDIAERNVQPEPRAAQGAKLIEERYVTFVDPTLGNYAPALEKVAKDRGGFTMLDVLVYERGTPTTDALLMKNNTMLESAAQFGGLSAEVIARGIRDNLSFAQIYARAGLEAAPDWIRGAREYLEPKWQTTFDWMQSTYAEVKQEFTQETWAASRLAIETLTEAGVVIKNYGPTAIEWSFNTSVWAGRKGVDTLQNTYRMLHKNGVVTGPVIDVIDNILRSATGYSMSELVLYQSAMESADEAKLEKHLEGISNESKWKEQFKKQLDRVATVGPTDIQTWVNAAQSDMNYEGKEMSQLTPYERMAIFELVKRRVYSFILDHRHSKPGEAINLTGKSWDAIEAGGKKIEQAYGGITLQLLSAERNDWDMPILPDQFEPSIEWAVNGSWQTLIQRPESRRYLVAMDEYYWHFRRQAESEFTGDEKTLKEYDAYLRTVLTNAVIDMTLAIDAERLEGGKTPRTAASATVSAEPLHLAIDRAQEFLNFMRSERGNSASSKHIKHLNLNMFLSDGDESAVAAYISEFKRRSGEVQTSEMTPEEEVNAQSLLLSPDLPDRTQQEILIRYIPKADSRERALISDKFDKLSDKSGLPIEQKLNVLQGASVSRARTVREALLNERKAKAEFVDLAKIAGAERDQSTSPEVLNELVDRAIVKTLSLVLDEIIKNKNADISKDTESQGKWRADLLTLYSVSRTPKTKDLVSNLLEFVEYQYKHNLDKDPKNGKVGFEKYHEFLKDNLKKPDLLAPPDGPFTYGNVTFNLDAKQRLNQQYDPKIKKEDILLQGSVAYFFDALGESFERKLKLYKIELNLSDK